MEDTLVSGEHQNVTRFVRCQGDVLAVASILVEAREEETLGLPTKTDLPNIEVNVAGKKSAPFLKGIITRIVKEELEKLPTQKVSLVFDIFSSKSVIVPAMQLLSDALRHLGLGSEYAGTEVEASGSVVCTVTRNSAPFWTSRVKALEQ
ncbi:hypothetical protein NEDG_00977 [Nematocida displodere]|uniref:Uncharacterized protein n=1 Tax=Nematocida displodere TaxID=1805483 RepID=A0A177EAL5_9MICR|nr:hypothetical protein NEDG_00977 [Nematocida displodere]